MCMSFHDSAPAPSNICGACLRAPYIPLSPMRVVIRFDGLRAPLMAPAGVFSVASVHELRVGEFRPAADSLISLPPPARRPLAIPASGLYA